ncbi:hypothetical protein O1L60_13880 [Streptomyces diastatochromogenes]|nr:hypothetical protein [Streptomyces diastatochromogenes]
MDDKKQDENPAGDGGLGAQPQRAGARTRSSSPLDDHRHPLPHPGPHAGHPKR